MIFSVRCNFGKPTVIVPSKCCYFDGSNFSYIDDDGGRWTMADRSCESVVTPSILQNFPQKQYKEMYKCYHLGMGDWTASRSDSDHKKENIEPTEKKHKSLKLNRKGVDRLDFIGEERENNLSRKYVPTNTAATTKWTPSNFNVWKQGRKMRFAGDSEKCVLERTTPVISTRCLSSVTYKHC